MNRIEYIRFLLCGQYIHITLPTEQVARTSIIYVFDSTVNHYVLLFFNIVYDLIKKIFFIIIQLIFIVMCMIKFGYVYL